MNWCNLTLSNYGKQGWVFKTKILLDFYWKLLDFSWKITLTMFWYSCDMLV